MDDMGARLRFSVIKPKSDGLGFVDENEEIIKHWGSSPAGVGSSTQAAVNQAQSPSNLAASHLNTEIQNARLYELQNHEELALEERMVVFLLQTSADPRLFLILGYGYLASPDELRSLERELKKRWNLERNLEPVRQHEFLPVKLFERTPPHLKRESKFRSHVRLPAIFIPEIKSKSKSSYRNEDVMEFYDILEGLSDPIADGDAKPKPGFRIAYLPRAMLRAVDFNPKQKAEFENALKISTAKGMEFSVSAQILPSFCMEENCCVEELVIASAAASAPERPKQHRPASRLSMSSVPCTLRMKSHFTKLFKIQVTPFHLGGVYVAIAGTDSAGNGGHQMDILAKSLFKSESLKSNAGAGVILPVPDVVIVEVLPGFKINIKRSKVKLPEYCLPLSNAVSDNNKQFVMYIALQVYETKSEEKIVKEKRAVLVAYDSHNDVVRTEPLPCGGNSDCNFVPAWGCALFAEEQSAAQSNKVYAIDVYLKDFAVECFGEKSPSSLPQLGFCRAFGTIQLQTAAGMRPKPVVCASVPGAGTKPTQKLIPIACEFDEGEGALAGPSACAEAPPASSSVNDKPTPAENDDDNDEPAQAENDDDGDEAPAPASPVFDDAGDAASSAAVASDHVSPAAAPNPDVNDVNRSPRAPRSDAGVDSPIDDDSSDREDDDDRRDGGRIHVPKQSGEASGCASPPTQALALHLDVHGEQFGGDAGLEPSNTDGPSQNFVPSPFDGPPDTPVAIAVAVPGGDALEMPRAGPSSSSSRKRRRSVADAATQADLDPPGPSPQALFAAFLAAVTIAGLPVPAPASPVLPAAAPFAMEAPAAAAVAQLPAEQHAWAPPVAEPLAAAPPAAATLPAAVLPAALPAAVPLLMAPPAAAPPAAVPLPMVPPVSRSWHLIRVQASPRRPRRLSERKRYPPLKFWELEQIKRDGSGCILKPHEDNVDPDPRRRKPRGKKSHEPGPLAIEDEENSSVVSDEDVEGPARGSRKRKTPPGQAPEPQPKRQKRKMVDLDEWDDDEDQAAREPAPPAVGASSWPPPSSSSERPAALVPGGALGQQQQQPRPSQWASSSSSSSSAPGQGSAQGASSSAPPRPRNPSVAQQAAGEEPGASSSPSNAGDAGVDADSDDEKEDGL
eukprot:tig00021098_g18207.t1